MTLDFIPKYSLFRYVYRDAFEAHPREKFEVLAPNAQRSSVSAHE